VERVNEALDPVTLTVTNNFLVTISREMGQAMQNTAYSPIFNEALDFSCAVFDEQGEMVGQGEFCPAQLGATTMALRWIIDEHGLDSFGPGDVYIHNDPYSGMNHLPEHMVVKAVFYNGERVGIVACIGHMAEVGGIAPGGFPGDAREVFQEGLRIPPVKIVKAGREDDEIFRMILANNRTPRVSAGDIRAMIGSLNVGERRLLELVARHGVERYFLIKEEIKDYSERRMRAAIRELPEGTYTAHEFIIDNDGWLDEPARVRVEVNVNDDRVVVDFTGSDEQRQGSCNCTLVATVSAVYNAILHVTDPDIPANAGRYRPIEVIAPPGTVVHATYPVATVGGNSEVHPHIVTLIWKAMADAVPDKVGASGSETAMLVTYGGVQPDTGEIYTNLILEGQGWGGKAVGDGYDAITVPNSNCVVTPVEVFETRYPMLHHEFKFNESSGGAGRSRGGLGTIRRIELRAPMTVSCYHSSERLYPWGLFGGDEGSLSSFKVLPAGETEYKNFKERFGVRCAGKFTNVHLDTGAMLELTVGGGGGYGLAAERDPERIGEDLLAGFYGEETIRKAYPAELVELAQEARARRLAALRARSGKTRT
jgi:N-methylhydantoinase B/oxoprolinase/acetone carboxylase alpha subunit